MNTRKLTAQVLFALNALVCGIWAYREVAPVLEMLSVSGSGGIASVIGGLPAMVVLSALTVGPPIVTIWLAYLSRPARLASVWRNVHLAIMLGLVILPMMGGVRMLVVSMVVFVPVQVFFVVGAIAIWIASPRKLPPTRAAV